MVRHDITAWQAATRLKHSWRELTSYELRRHIKAEMNFEQHATIQAQFTPIRNQAQEETENAQESVQTTTGR